jgi:hypothetical protein
MQKGYLKKVGRAQELSNTVPKDENVKNSFTAMLKNIYVGTV